MQRLCVLFPTFLNCFDYISENPLTAGTFVKAPFGRKTQIGVVWNYKTDNLFPVEKLKTVVPMENLPPLPRQTLDFVNWVASYTVTPLGAVLKMVLCIDFEKQSKKPSVFPPPLPDFSHLMFSGAQQKAIKQLSAPPSGFRVSLLDGVTGSGKTEVYFELLADVFRTNAEALVLLPEITLTTAWLRRFERRFGVLPAVWHSSLTAKQRRDTWKGVLSGQIKITVGARSALFLPFQNLKMIVVDEEHDSSYKQEDGVLYQARDMAVVRGKIADAPVILASATPSIETYCNVVGKKYQHVVLPERFAGAVMPDIILSDMRQKKRGPIRFISPLLETHLSRNLKNGNQSLLFLNRRGYAPLILCRSCGERLKCPHCSAWLIEHKQKNKLLCHHCGYERSIPKVCPNCQAENMFVSCGPGVERILEETEHLFPNARTALITSDTLDNIHEFDHILNKIASRELDILIGTQILAKGHHFADLTLVGIIDADMSLSGGDLRAGERTFQLLQQVMGRAGREQKKGIAIIQTYSPDNLIIQALQKNDRALFLREEIKARKLLNMPPFGQLAAFVISSKNQVRAYQTSRQIATFIRQRSSVEVLGPVAAPIAVIRNKYRFRILIKAPKNIRLQNVFKNWRETLNIPSSVDVRLDINPYNFL